MTRSEFAKRTSSADAAISMRQSPFGTTRRVPSQKQQSDTSTFIVAVFVSPGARSTFANALISFAGRPFPRG